MEHFKKFSTYEVEDFSALHDLAYPDSSKSTKTTFSQGLKRIERIYDKPLTELDLVFLKDPKALWKHLQDSEYTKNTQLTTYTQILKILKIIDAPLHLYNSYLKLLQQKTSEREEDKLLEIKENQKNLIPWDTMIDKYEDKFDDMLEGQTFNKVRNYLLLGLFLLQIPVRVSNFTRLKLTNKSDVIGGEATRDSNNYLYKKETFVFNKYRTNHILGQKLLVITNERLKELIEYFIDIYDLKTYLLPTHETSNTPMNSKDINRAIATMTLELFEKSFNITDIRSAYMIDAMEKEPNLKDKMEIAAILGYTTTEQLDNHS